MVCSCLLLHRLYFKGFPVFLKGRWNTSDFIAQYISFVVFLLPYVSYKLVVRSKVSPYPA